MSGYINKVTLIGNLGRDPEIRHSADGMKIATISLATSEYWKDRTTGERRDKTEWHRIVIFNERIVEVIEKYVKKGSKLYIEGQLQTRKWTDQQGIEKYTTEVVLQRFRGELTMLDSRGGENTFEDSSSSNSPNSPKLEMGGSDSTSNLEDEIPF